MDNIIEIELGSEADKRLREAFGYSYRVRIATHGPDAVKVAVGGGMWSPPLSTKVGRENPCEACGEDSDNGRACPCTRHGGHVPTYAD